MLQDPKVGKLAVYWIERAKMEEELGNYPEVVRLFEEASDRYAQVLRSESQRIYFFSPLKTSKKDSVIS